jgi:hypothetical protein
MTENARRRWLSPHALRSVASVGCFTLCVSFCVLWARSYAWSDDLVYGTPKSVMEVLSFDGSLYLVVGRGDSLTGPRLYSRSAADARSIIVTLNNHGYKLPKPILLGFGWGGVFPQQSGILIPHWSLVALVAIGAFALKPKPRYRFSMLDFLALTTSVALLAALVAWLVRLRS